MNLSTALSIIVVSKMPLGAVPDSSADKLAGYIIHAIFRDRDFVREVSDLMDYSVNDLRSEAKDFLFLPLAEVLLPLIQHLAKQK